MAHPEKINGIYIFLVLLVWLLFWSLLLVVIFVDWKGKIIGTGTALYIGLAYGGLVFMLTVLADLVWLLFHWNRSMSWKVLFPHFLAILIVLLWTGLFPYRRVRDNLNGVERRRKNYDERRKKYD